MKDIKIFQKLSEIISGNKEKMNEVNFVPRVTIPVIVDNKRMFVGLICDDNFKVKVVLLDENFNINFEIMEFKVDNVSIAKLKDKIYAFTDRMAYICDINDLSKQPKEVYLGKLDIQGITSNDNFIYVYSIERDKIIKYDENLNVVEEYDNRFSTPTLRLSLKLACNNDTFFSIPIMVPNQEQYIKMQEFIGNNINRRVGEANTMISSCSFNNKDNTLYISMYNIIWVIKDGKEFSYIHFKDKGITSVMYDNDLDELIVNFGGKKGIHVCGSVLKLPADEISSRLIPLDNVKNAFLFSSNKDNKDINHLR